MKAKMHQQCTSEECPKECTSKCPIAPSLNRLRWLAPTFLPPTDERCTQSNDALHYNCHNAPTLRCVVSAHTEEKSTALCSNNVHCIRTCTRSCTCTCTSTCNCTCTMHNAHAHAHCTCPYLAPTPTLNCATKRGELTNVWWVNQCVYQCTIVPKHCVVPPRKVHHATQCVEDGGQQGNSLKDLGHTPRLKSSVTMTGKRGP